jgi:putative Mg2+ transporter-C (MgtC) family protein
MLAMEDFAKNLGWALLCGGLIGLEREYRGHDAGIRTNALVAVGAAMFTMVSQILGDAGRVAAQLVTGIGFIGAGTILKAGEHVKGLTTAATLWVVAGIGMFAGLGQTKMALVATVAVLVLNFLLAPIERWYQRRQDRQNAPSP